MGRGRPGLIDFAGPLWQVLDFWNASRQAFGLQTQAMLEAWVRCRTADLEEGMKLYEELIGCKDPAQMVRLQRQWLFDTADRLQAEIKDLTDKAGKPAAPDSAAAAPSAKPERDAAE
jgi:hypothetical protein